MFSGLNTTEMFLGLALCYGATAALVDIEHVPLHQRTTAIIETGRYKHG